MHCRAMQALAEVLYPDLPVPRDVARGRLDDAQRAKTEPLVGERVVVVRGDVVLERAGLAAKVDEENALPLRNRHAVQAVLRPVYLVGADAWRTDQFAVEAVDPRMVGARDRALEGSGAGVAEQCTAVAAHVVERTQRAVVIADDHDVLAGDLGRAIRPGRFDVLGAAGAGPAAAEDGVDLALEDLVGPVQLGGEGFAAHGHRSTIRRPDCMLSQSGGPWSGFYPRRGCQPLSSPRCLGHCHHP